MILNLDEKGLYFHYEELPLKASIYSHMEGWLSKSQETYAQKRKEDYLAGRYCAKISCEQMGNTLDKLPMNEDRSPRWPDGIAGSISHTKTFVIAVVSTEFLSVGIDVEEQMSLDRYKRVKHLILSDNEEKLIESDLGTGATLVFSSKEALYKLIYPLSKTYFGFREASVISFSDGKFVIKLHSKQDAIIPYNGTYIGKYQSFSGKVLTLLSLKSLP